MPRVDGTLTPGYKRKHIKLVTYFDTQKQPKLGDITTGRILGQQNGCRKIYVKCPMCGESHWSRFNKKEQIKSPICQRCRVSREGKDNPNWKGGRSVSSDGYVRLHIARNDFFRAMAGKDGTVREHRLVMAKHLNRCLLPWEIVHHKNGIKDDNRFENLTLLPAAHYHISDSHLKKQVKKLEKRIENLEAENDVLKYELGM